MFLSRVRGFGFANIIYDFIFPDNMWSNFWLEDR